jgi:hypothetical protein
VGVVVTRPAARWVLVLAAVACLVAGVFPRWAEWTDPATGDRVQERRNGLWSSPSYTRVRRDHPHGGSRVEERVGWVSWSSLLVLAGLAGLEVVRQSGRPPGATQPG